MGDSRRFQVFAQFISKQFPHQDTHIADVAGGKGDLQLALRELGYTNVTTFDKRKKKKITRGVRYQHRWFDTGVKQDFNLLLGMHPDEATDVIVVEAARRSIPFAIVPCCVMPNAITFWGQHNYRTWLSWLETNASKRGHRVERFYLNIQGKNTVLLGRLKGE